MSDKRYTVGDNTGECVTEERDILKRLQHKSSVSGGAFMLYDYFVCN